MDQALNVRIGVIVKLSIYLARSFVELRYKFFNDCNCQLSF